MKSHIVALFTIMLVIVSCKNEPQIEYAILHGKIKNPIGKTIHIEGNDGSNFSKSIALKEDGTFRDTVYAKPGYYTLKYHKLRIKYYLEPGFNLQTDINTEVVEISGKGAENSNYLASKGEIYSQILPDFVSLYSQEEAVFYNRITELKASWGNLIKNTPNLSKEFISFEQKSIHYYYLLNLERYAFYHGFFTGKKNIKVSEKFKTPLISVNFGNDKEFVFFTSYHDLVRQHYANRIRNEKNISVIFDEISAFKAPILKESLAKKFNNYILPSEENNEALYNGVLRLSSNTAFKQELIKRYLRIKPLAKGKTSPQFNTYKNHKGGTTSLEDLKGKYVYIDIWATWCSPCIREFPFLKKLEKDYRNKNITFVSISIDKAKDYDKWVQLVQDEALEGVQLFADNAYESKFIKEYVIDGIPRFILIDPEGKIIHGNAQRPSDPKLIEIFDQLGM
ncbi:MAG: TlpA family protein disulfide reductase [Flavobacteriaceae bacterium]|nr:TlpA family protein disulfide reductase [Flavobacteriaceae bacterium]